jgi:hypothetical protein
MDEIKYLKYKAKYLALKEKQEGGGFLDEDLGTVWVFADEDLLTEIHKIHKKGENKVEIIGVPDYFLNFNDIMKVPKMEGKYYISSKYPNQIRPCQVSRNIKMLSFRPFTVSVEQDKVVEPNDDFDETFFKNMKKNISLATNKINEYLLFVINTIIQNLNFKYVVKFHIGSQSKIIIEDILKINETTKNLESIKNWMNNGSFISLYTTKKEAIKSAATATLEAASKLGKTIVSIPGATVDYTQEKICSSYIKKIKELNNRIKELEGTK